MIQAYKLMLSNYANFSGRANRAEYWWVVLDNVIINMILGILGRIGPLATVASILSMVFSLAILVPSIALTIRRLHDIDKSGWFVLLSLIPCIGGIIVLVFVCMAGTPGPNKFGEPSTNM